MAVPTGGRQNRQQQPQPQQNQPPADPLSNPASFESLQAHYANTPFGSDPNFQQTLKNYAQWATGPNTGDKNAAAQAIYKAIDRYTQTFQGMFQDKVGRPPTAGEYGQFFSQVVNPENIATGEIDPTKVTNETQSLLANFYTQAAQDTATQKLKDLATQETAPGSAFDQWSQAYMGSINDVEKNLTDYQTRLMDKIRPQLLTSLQSQGLLDTGALNEAFAGKAADLASTASNYVAGLRGQAAQDVANQRYAIQANPANYQVNNAMASVPNMIGQGQTAMNNLWNNYMQNQAFNQNMQLIDKQNSQQPSLLQQYGGMILGGTAAGLGQGLANPNFWRAAPAAAAAA